MKAKVRKSLSDKNETDKIEKYLFNIFHQIKATLIEAAPY